VAGLAREVVDADGSEIVAVRRTNLTERKKRQALYVITERMQELPKISTQASVSFRKVVSG
jgi:hypothetical protein